MTQEKFHATAHYNDLRGTAAPDRHDLRTMNDYLAAKKLAGKGEFIVGVKLWSGEVHAAVQDQPVRINVPLSKQGAHDEVKAAVESSRTVKARKVSFQMPLAEFFRLFKRFEIAISAKGLINGLNVDVVD